MPNDPTDPVEDAIRRAGVKSKRKVSYVDMLQGIFKAATSPFRFPSNERMKTFVDNNKRESEYWYERQQPGYLPPGHPDRRK